jgi:hypothetical protein
MNATVIEQSVAIATSAALANYMMPSGASFALLAFAPVLASYASSYMFSAKAQQAASVVVSGATYMIVGVVMSAGGAMNAILGGFFVSIFTMLFGYVLSDFA